MIDTIKNIVSSYSPKPLGEEKQYAVLLPLIWQDGQWYILYEVRSQHISQPGEVSFPGGRLEKGESYQAAAVRETMEELNLLESEITVWGEIDYIVQTKRTIHCFVGQLNIDDWKSIQSNEEVDSLFALPLEIMLTKTPVYYEIPHRIKKGTDFPFDRIRNGEKYNFNYQSSKIPFYEDFEESIWGLTAQFTNRFIQIIKGS